MSVSRSVGVGVGVPPVLAGLPVVPAGLQALYSACAALYTDQPNPLQVAAVVKYWLGGPDPLDYISMYSNAGDPDNDIAPHWHYVSFGLSDLHGDGRVHDVSGPESPSGFGFELSFRLKKEPDETAPPTWPAAVIQGLAKYVFQSDNILCDGDHVSWHCPLDNSESRIQHMLMTKDPQLGSVNTPFGPVQFIQIVGVCSEELKAAQHWNGRSFLQLMKGVSGAGGPWLITDMRRGESVFELDADVEEAVQMGISSEGSDLSGVGAKMKWSEQMVSPNMSPTHFSSQPGLDGNYNQVDKREEEDGVEEGMPQTTRYLKAIHLQLNLEAGLLLPLMLKGRLKHGRHFTFKGALDCSAVTFVVSSVAGAFVTEEQPFGVQGSWCQVLLQDDLLEDMMDDFEHLATDDPDMIALPKLYSWPHHHISITLVPEEDC